MTKKWPIFTGIILLTAGIILKKSTDVNTIAISLMAAGVILKIYYILNKIKRGEYKPGKELVLLFIGLLLFFTGLYFRSHVSIVNPTLLIGTGITLKVAFVILFIRKSRVYNESD